jgi:hypothetical protein
VAGVRIPHDAQDGRRIRLQHINNNHPHATAKGSQVTEQFRSSRGGCRSLMINATEGGRPGPRVPAYRPWCSDQS